MNSKQPFAEGIDSQWEVVWSSYIKMDLCVHLDENLSMYQKVYKNSCGNWNKIANLERISLLCVLQRI